MNKLFFLLGFVLGNFRELMEFVQRTRLPSAMYEVEPFEYLELTIPHSAVRQVVGNLYAVYMDKHTFSSVEHEKRMVADSLGSLVPISALSRSQEFEPRELMVFYNGSKAIKSGYIECFKMQKKGLCPIGCFKEVLYDSVEPVNRWHANSAIYFLVAAKRISQVNRLPAFSTPAQIPVDEDYCEGMYKYICDNVTRIANDRLTMLPEVIYVISLLRYVYHMALFLGRVELSKEVFGMMKVLQNSGNVFANSFVQAERLPTPHRILYKDKVMHVDSILTLGVPQQQRLEKDVMHIFFKDNNMYVSFPQYHNDALSSILAAAKQFLLTSIVFKENPMSRPIYN